MSLGLAIDLEDSISGILAAVGASLDDRTLLNDKIGQDELTLVQEHLKALSYDRHDSANRLGAQPSGFWENAAGQTTLHADAQQAVVSVKHPGIGRALHDVTIVPGAGKQYLTLPLLAVAYNQRAAGLDNLFVIRSHESALFLARHEDADKESGLEILYLLVRSVLLPQDRTLLPTDEEFEFTALRAAQEYFQAIFAGQSQPQGGLN